MRAALLICTVILALTGLKLINVDKDVVTATVVAFLAVLCIWGAFTIQNVRDNNDLN